MNENYFRNKKGNFYLLSVYNICIHNFVHFKSSTIQILLFERNSIRMQLVKMFLKKSKKYQLIKNWQLLTFLIFILFSSNYIRSVFFEIDLSNFLLIKKPAREMNKSYTISYFRSYIIYLIIHQFIYSIISYICLYIKCYIIWIRWSITDFK